MFTISYKSSIILQPKQLNDIDGNILEELAGEFEGKIGEYGLIIKIRKLISRSYGKFIEGNLSAELEYQVVFEALTLNIEPGSYIPGIYVTSIKEPGVYAQHQTLPLSILIPGALKDYSEDKFVEFREKNQSFSIEVLTLKKYLGGSSINIVAKLLLESTWVDRKVRLPSPILMDAEPIAWFELLKKDEIYAKPSLIDNVKMKQNEYCQTILKNIDPKSLDKIREYPRKESEIENEIKENFTKVKKIFWDISTFEVDIREIITMTRKILSTSKKDEVIAIRLLVNLSIPVTKIFYLIWLSLIDISLFKPLKSAEIDPEFFIIGIRNKRNFDDILKTLEDKIKPGDQVKDLLFDPSVTSTYIPEFLRDFGPFIKKVQQQFSSRILELEWLTS